MTAPHVLAGSWLIADLIPLFQMHYLNWGFYPRSWRRKSLASRPKCEERRANTTER